jgi:hypothetical protein
MITILFFVSVVLGSSTCILNQTLSDLPFSVVVSSYHLAIDLPSPNLPDHLLSFSGKMIMSLEVRIETSCIVFHAESPVIVKSVALEGVGRSIVSFSQMGRDMILVALDGVLNVASRPVLTVSFVSHVNLDPLEPEGYLGFFVRNNTAPASPIRTRNERIRHQFGSRKVSRTSPFLMISDDEVEDKEDHRREATSAPAWRRHRHGARRFADCEGHARGNQSRMFASLFQELNHSSTRTAWPVFDDYQFKAYWSFEITAPAQLTAVTNTPVESETLIGSRKRWIFRRTKIPIAPYLVGVYLGEFDVIRNDSFGVYSPLGTATAAQSALDASVAYTAYFEKFFDIPFARVSEKLDTVCIPGLGLALENLGAIGSSISLSSEFPAFVVQDTQAHEICHQWMGDLATVPNERQLFVQEGSTFFLAHFARSELRPEDEVFSLNPVLFSASFHKFRVRALRLDFAGGVVPAVVLDTTLVSHSTIFYVKGSIINRNVALFLGPETWREGMRRLVKRHFARNADYLDWADSFVQVSNS